MKKARDHRIWRLTRPLTLLGAFLLPALVTGCDDDEGFYQATAGSGGSGGSAGTAGTAGTAGGGAGGTAGAAGGGAGGTT